MSIWKDLIIAAIVLMFFYIGAQIAIVVIPFLAVIYLAWTIFVYWFNHKYRK